VLHEGEITFQGQTESAVHHFFNEIFVANQADGHIFDFTNARHRTSKLARVLQRIELYTQDDLPVLEGIRVGGSLKLKLYLDFPTPTRSFDVGLGFNNAYDQRIFTAHSLFEPNRPSGEWVGSQVFVCEIPSFTLMPGIYNLFIWVDINHQEADRLSQAAQVTVLESDYYGTGKAPWNGALVLDQHWYLESPSTVERYSNRRQFQ
jgi:hypothetical protein